MSTPVTAPAVRVGYVRWTVCALLFFASTVNYIDRQVLGILQIHPEVKALMGGVDAEANYGNVVLVFQLAYAISLLVAGRVMDKIGTRIGYALSVTLWSLCSMSHSLAKNATHFAISRFGLGLGEAGTFPASIKTVAEWFPKKERALAIGLFNSGTNIGALVAPMAVPFIAFNYGWRWAFILTGITDFIWLALWLKFYRRPEEHKGLSKAEFDYIRSDPQEPSVHVPWKKLFPFKQTWAFAVGKFLTDPIWWFFLFWLPKFLETHGLSLRTVGLPLVTIYLAADIGSIGGGWLSSTLIKRGWSVNRARKTAMLVCACCVLPVFLASRTTNLWLAIGLISLAMAAHQGWSANLFATVGDMFPNHAVGSVTGIGGMAGAAGGMLIAWGAGQILSHWHTYVPLFIIASVAYVTAWLFVHLFAPRLQPAQLTE
jgi:ACS family hexuronate transporter-like MFS transporter